MSLPDGREIIPTILFSLSKILFRSQATTASQDTITVTPRHPKIYTQKSLSAFCLNCSHQSFNSKTSESTMNQIASLLFIFSSVTILSIARAQERAPHGLANENPVAFPPSAVEFFHPKKQEPETIDPCASSKCSPLPVAAQVEATQAYESRLPTTSQKSRSRFTTGGIAGTVVGSALVVLLPMGAYYVVITRRANVNRANSVQPNV